MTNYSQEFLDSFFDFVNQTNFDSLAQQSAFMAYAHERYLYESGVVLSVDLDKWYRTFRHKVIKPKPTQHRVVHIRAGYRKNTSSKLN